MTDERLTVPESLRVIRETIDLAKSGFRQDGFHFLLWGWLVAIASAADWYVAMVLQDERHSLVWLCMFIGVPVSLIREARRDKHEKVQNIVREWYSRIWLGYGISMMLAIPILGSAGISPVPVILILTGFATYMSGILLKFQPLLIGAIIIFILSTWMDGRGLLAKRHGAGSLTEEEFLGALSERHLSRVPGTGLFLTAQLDRVPFALLHNMRHNRILHERIVMTTLITEARPFVPGSKRCQKTHARITASCTRSSASARGLPQRPRIVLGPAMTSSIA